MTRDDVVKRFTELKGIGKAKAELLYDHGFTSVEKLSTATVEDLSSIKGITKKNAEDLLAQLQKPSEKKTTEKKPKPASDAVKKTKEPAKKSPASAEEAEEKAAVEIVEDTDDAYHAKRKPVLTDSQKEQLILRKKIKQRTPRFLRQEWFRFKRIPMNWRRPTGITSKMRMHKGYRPSVVRVGFRGPKDVRGLHSSGFKEVLVYTVSDVERLDPKTQAARIGGTVGTRKRTLIVKRADELDVRVLNAGV